MADGAAEDAPVTAKKHAKYFAPTETSHIRISIPTAVTDPLRYRVCFMGYRMVKETNTHNAAIKGPRTLNLSE